MEGARFFLAILLSIAVVIVVNLMFPPVPPRTDAARDTAAVQVPDDTLRAPDTPPARPLVPGTADAVGADSPGAAGAADAAVVTDVPDAADASGDTVWVTTDVARYGIDTRGARMVSVELLGFESYTREGPVQLVDSLSGEMLALVLQVGDRELPLRAIDFSPSLTGGDTIRAEADGTLLELTGSLNGLDVRVTYTFVRDRYLVDLEGGITGLGSADATLLFALGPRLAVNEEDAREDLRALGYVVNSRRRGIESVAIDRLDGDRIEEGPLTWVALKNKYFLAAALQPAAGAAAFGGLIATAAPDRGVRSIHATLPLDETGAFSLRLFFGPQDYSRLSAIGHGLEDVNPYGWRIFRPIIRPLAHIVTWLLVALHGVMGIGYGWVLILFGFVMRGLLWPLNAKAMRSQLKTMELQPRIKEIQTKYKEKPELLQKEMVRLYKEEGFNPLGGCLPMLLPWPVLITLFFVFQNTIEFRGVEFLWLPDLSRPDPFYLLPVLLGLSLFALQYMSFRSMPQSNPQQKMIMYIMPVMMVVIFLNFASGLNLYYAASNVASLPQQVQIIRERKRAKQRLEEKADRDDADAAEVVKGGATGKGSGDGKGSAGGKSGGKSRKARKGRKGTKGR